MDKFNGHKNWDYWNVSLWIGNDEGLYRMALDCVRDNANLRDAAEEFIAYIPEDKTPDGARYTVPNVMAAMRGLKD